MYQVAWKNGAADQVSRMDRRRQRQLHHAGHRRVGQHLVRAIVRTDLHQDLNDDGTIGPITTTIESFGATSLVQVADSYFRDTMRSSRSPVECSAAVAAGQFGAWTPIGAEQTVRRLPGRLEERRRRSVPRVEH